MQAAVNSADNAGKHGSVTTLIQLFFCQAGYLANFRPSASILTATSFIASCRRCCNPLSSPFFNPYCSR